MTDVAPVPIHPDDEDALALSASVGAIWTGSRVLIGACSFLYAAFVFAFFYLRSLNSHGMWHPEAQQPSVLIGVVAAVALVGAAVLHYFGLTRLRSGLNLDWRVSALATLVLGVFSVGMEVFQLTRLNFYPGSSGYASVFVAWVPVQIVLILGALYWLETLVARSLRVRVAWAGEGDLGGSVTPAATRMRASIDAFNYFFGFLALAGVAFWFLFYVVG